MKNIIYLLLFWLFSGCSNSIDGELVFIEPDENDSFNFPYFLFIPDDISREQRTFVVIEPNNSGFADDDLQKHIEKAERIATRDFYLGNFLARNLNAPLLIPVFPRHQSEWKIYTHALDRDVMIQKDSPIERLDLQLLGMFNHACLHLKEKGIDAEEKFLLTGFSASGTFANRFALIHPDKVQAVAAGGVNGLLMLPLDSLSGIGLNYPLGTSDFSDISDRDFQKELFVQTPQFYYMGELDDNDAVPYEDAFDQDEREHIYFLLGKEMLTERWNRCREIYNDYEVNATIKTFKNVGHENPDIIKEEVVDFFRKNIN